MKIQYWCRQDKVDEIDKLIASFGSHFWLRERRWLVRCDWNPEYNSSYVCLYTLPYPFSHFATHTAPIQSRSTSHSDNDYSFYASVRSLCYDSSLSSSSALSRAQFSNNRHLSIGLPLNDGVWPSLTTFEHMRSLDVLVLNDDARIQNQLQHFLDRAPNLYSLKFSCTKWSASELV
jgi:hypothetical protein